MELLALLETLGAAPDARVADRGGSTISSPRALGAT
jgi:hypothetical protein